MTNYELKDATRVELIDETGRSVVRWYEPGVMVSVQDDGRTVKVFAGRRADPQYGRLW